jgi:putative ribosome biogenesis GTPase RsgA
LGLKGLVVVVVYGNETQHEDKDKAEEQVECNYSSLDSGFILGDDSSSEEDEEAKEILRKFKQFNKKLRSGQVAHLDDIVLESSTTMIAGYSVAEDGNETPYLDTDDEESVEEVGTDGELK